LSSAILSDCAGAATYQYDLDTETMRPVSLTFNLGTTRGVRQRGPRPVPGGEWFTLEMSASLF
jgi:hypothetical protein